MIQTHRCHICGDLATDKHEEYYLCDKIGCVAQLFIEIAQQHS